MYVILCVRLNRKKCSMERDAQRGKGRRWWKMCERKTRRHSQTDRAPRDAILMNQRRCERSRTRTPLTHSPQCRLSSIEEVVLFHQARQVPVCACVWCPFFVCVRRCFAAICIRIRKKNTNVEENGSIHTFRLAIGTDRRGRWCRCLVPANQWVCVCVRAAGCL